MMSSLSRKLLGFVIAPLGACSIIGTGFASWLFGGLEDTETAGPFEHEVNVTTEVKNGTFEIVQAPTLLLFSEGTLGASNLFDGITFYSEKELMLPGNDKPVTTTESDSTFTFRYIYDDPLLVDEEAIGMKLNVGIAFELTNKEGATSSSIMENYLEISSNIKDDQNGYRREETTTNGDYYFFLTDNPEYATTNLHFEIELKDISINQTDGTQKATKCIDYSVALNQFLRYENSEVKPLDAVKYDALNKALTDGQWGFKVKLISYFTVLEEGGNQNV